MAEGLALLADVHDPKLVGGKAASLGRMLREGVPVPPGYVVTQGALEAFLAESFLASPLARHERRLANCRRSEIADVSGSIRDLVLSSPLPVALSNGV